MNVKNQTRNTMARGKLVWIYVFVIPTMIMANNIALLKPSFQSSILDANYPAG